MSSKFDLLSTTFDIHGVFSHRDLHSTSVRIQGCQNVLDVSYKTRNANSKKVSQMPGVGVFCYTVNGFQR